MANGVQQQTIRMRMCHLLWLLFPKPKMTSGKDLWRKEGRSEDLACPALLLITARLIYCLPPRSSLPTLTSSYFGWLSTTSHPYINHQPPIDVIHKGKNNHGPPSTLLHPSIWVSTRLPFLSIPHHWHLCKSVGVSEHLHF